MNDTLGPERDVICGNGQRNPPSAYTFNIGSDRVLKTANTISDIPLQMEISSPLLALQTIIYMV
jgi:hypothetical protein